MFFELARLAEARRPPYLFFENVPGLLSHDKGRTFGTILSTLGKLGYYVEWSVLNSANFHVAQSRRRVFIIGYLDPRCAGKVFPIAGDDAKALIQIIGGPQGSRVYDPAGVACTQTAGAGGMGGKTGLYLVDLCAGRPEQTSIARCITARYGQTSLSNHPRERSGVLFIKQFQHFSANLLRDMPFIAANKDLSGYDKGVTRCLLVTTKRNQDGILVDCQGFNYARYSAYVRDKRSLDLRDVPVDHDDLNPRQPHSQQER